jgi:ribosome maturation factor RimP
MSQLSDDISTKVCGFLGSQGYELIELNIIHHRSADIIQILTDKPQGGITIEECAALHREIYHLLDEGRISIDDFSVEVSSPGIDRPLSTRKDFLRNRGKAVQIFLKDFFVDKKEYQGIIKELDEEHIFIDNNQMVQRIPISLIQKAQQII